MCLFGPPATLTPAISRDSTAVITWRNKCARSPFGTKLAPLEDFLM